MNSFIVKDGNGNFITVLDGPEPVLTVRTVAELERWSAMSVRCYPAVRTVLPSGVSRYQEIPSAVPLRIVQEDCRVG